jgi:hypothetical protein
MKGNLHVEVGASFSWEALNAFLACGSSKSSASDMSCLVLQAIY